MKHSTYCAALLLALASPTVLAAPGSCERIQSDISQRIYRVDQPDSVVGHCANAYPKAASR